MTNKTLTRLELSDALIDEIGLPRTETIDLVEQVLEEISDAALRGEDIKISHFGTFGLIDKTQRVGRNPKTGEVVPVTPRRVITFRPSAKIKAYINEKCTKVFGNAR